MKIFFLIFCILLCSLSYSQIDYSLIPYRKGKLWGFCDSAKKILIKPQFDKVEFFEIYQAFNSSPSVALAIVSAKKKYGILDQKGKMLVPCKYNSAENTYFKKKSLYCILLTDSSGSYIYNVYTKTIKKVLPTDVSMVFPPPTQEGIGYRYDENLTLTRTGKEDYLVIRRVTNIYQKAKSSDGYDSSVISAISLRKVMFSDSLLFIQKATGWGLISLSGSMLIPAIYDSIYSVWDANVFAIQTKRKFAAIRPSKKLSSAFIYDSVVNNKKSHGFLIHRDDKWGVLFEDLKKDVLIDTILYDTYLVDIENRLIVVLDKYKTVGYVHFNGTRYWD